MVSFLLTCSPPWLSLIAAWFLLGATSLGSAVDAGLDAAARVLWAERAADGGVVDIPQAFHVSPSTPPFNAQRVARFDHYYTRNLLLPKKLRRDIQ